MIWGSNMQNLIVKAVVINLRIREIELNQLVLKEDVQWNGLVKSFRRLQDTEADGDGAG